MARRIDQGMLVPDDVVPALIISAQARYEETEPWYTTAVVELLSEHFGGSGLRLCEACTAPRTLVDRGVLAYQTGPVTIDEVIRLDEAGRGDAIPAKSAIWIDEHRGGVSIRIVDLATSHVIFAQNVDPYLIEYANTERMYTLSEEYERRARGDSITQAFVDLTLYPGQHVSLDWTEQWGRHNGSLTGITLSLYDPVVGIGGVHYQRTQILDALVGGKVIVSLPTALTKSLGDQGPDLIDPMLTAVGLVRVPFGRSNYGVVLSASTNGQIGVGISLMNISLLPVLL